MRPVIGPVSADAESAPGVPVRVPVIRDGKVVYVLRAVVRPDSFEEIITAAAAAGRMGQRHRRSRRPFRRTGPARPAGELGSGAFRAALLAGPGRLVSRVDRRRQGYL